MGEEKLKRIESKTMAVISPSGWRVSMASPAAEIPTSHIGAELRKRIESGELGIMELCNCTNVGCKWVDPSFAEQQSAANQLLLSKQYVKGSNPVLFYSRKRDCCASTIVGDERTSYNWADLWQMTSPPFQHRPDAATGETRPECNVFSATGGACIQSLRCSET